MKIGEVSITDTNAFLLSSFGSGSTKSISWFLWFAGEDG
jgi:hypothetical protein